MRLLAFALLVTLAAAEDVASLRRALRSDDVGARWRAAWALGQLGEQARPAVPALVVALGDRDKATRFAAEFALARIGAGDVAARTVADPEQPAWTRRGAAGVLARLRASQAVPQLTAALKIADTKLRLRALEAMAAIGEPAAPAVPQLIKLLGKESLHEALAVAFGAIGQSALEPLGKAVLKGSTKSRTGAAKALGRLGKPAVKALIPALNDKKHAVALAAIRSLERIGKDAAPAYGALRRHVFDKRRTSDAAQRALNAITSPLSTAMLLRGLESAVARRTEAGSLASAAYALADAGPTKAAVPLLLRMLETDDSRVAMAACHALGTIGRDASAARDKLCNVLVQFRNEDKLKPLLKRYSREAQRVYPGVDRASRLAREVWVERKLGQARVGPWRKEVRVVAIWALARLRDPGGKVMPYLAAASRSEETIVSDYAFAARWVLGDKHSLSAEALEHQLDFHDMGPGPYFGAEKLDYHINYAHDLIVVLGPAARELISALVSCQLIDSPAMVAMGALAVPELRRQLMWRDTRAAALRALTRMGSEAQDAAPQLIGLCGKEEHAAAAERALEAIGTAAVPALRKGLAHKKSALRRSCARVLGRLKADDALPDLKRLAAEDPNVWVRYEAHLAVSRP